MAAAGVARRTLGGGSRWQSISCNVSEFQSFKAAAPDLSSCSVQFLTLLYMTVYGIASIALTSSEQVAAILSGTVYFLMELFCGASSHSPCESPSSC